MVIFLSRVCGEAELTAFVFSVEFPKIKGRKNKGEVGEESFVLNYKNVVLNYKKISF
jgi:hypothetical protein